MTIKNKVVFAVLGALALFVLSNIATQLLIKQTNATIVLVVDVNGERAELLNTLTKEASKREVLLLNLVLLDPDDDHYQENSEVIQEKLKAGADIIAGSFNRLNELQMSEKDKALYEEVKTTMQSANTAFSGFMIAVNEGFQEDAFEIMQEEFTPKYKRFSELVNALQESGKNSNKQAIEQLYQEQNDSLFYLLIGTAITIVLFIIGGFWLVRSIVKPIDNMQTTLSDIVSSGDLSHRVPVKGKDELANISKAVNELLDDISQTVNRVNEVLRNTASGDFSEKVDNDLRGDFLHMKNEVNASIEQIASIVNILEITAQNFRSGELKVHKDDSVKLAGKFESVLYDLDRSAIRMKDNVGAITETLQALAKGDFSARLEFESRGDFIALQEALNITLSDLEAFVNEVSRVQQQISQGDLTHQVDGIYQGKMHDLQESLNQSVKNTALMVAKVELITDSVATGVEELVNGNMQINQRIKRQLEAIEDTSSSMEEMTNSVKHNAQSAEDAKIQTDDVQQQLSVGLQTMDSALQSMDKMADANNKINEITGIIDSIAFQTNLLALNAAVEAARAGEHGRGFAVVAGEVRGLAGKSAEAAGEIKKLIENSVQISQESGRLVRDTSKALEKINQSMQQVSEKINDITVTSDEQAKGVEHVNRSVHTMDDMTQGNAEFVAQAAEASHGLLASSQSLQEQVRQFKFESDLVNGSLLTKLESVAPEQENQLEAIESQTELESLYDREKE